MSSLCAFEGALSKMGLCSLCLCRRKWIMRFRRSKWTQQVVRGEGNCVWVFNRGGFAFVIINGTFFGSSCSDGYVLDVV